MLLSLRVHLIWGEEIQEGKEKTVEFLFFFQTYKDAAVEDEHHNFEKAGATHLGWFLFFTTL